jgi:hypothetical protein
VDACRNDPLSKTARARPQVKFESVTRPILPDPPGGIVAFFSCSTGEVAYENEALKHGVFFHYVIAGLRGDAARARDGRVTLPLLEDYVKDNVERFVRDKHGVRQMPELKGTSRGLVPLVSLNAIKPTDAVKPERAIPGEELLPPEIRRIADRSTLAKLVAIHPIEELFKYPEVLVAKKDQAQKILNQLPGNDEIQLDGLNIYIYSLSRSGGAYTDAIKTVNCATLARMSLIAADLLEGTGGREDEVNYLLLKTFYFANSSLLLAEKVLQKTNVTIGDKFALRSSVDEIRVILVALERSIQRRYDATKERTPNIRFRASRRYK